MRAVWSYWSAPFADHRAGAWGSETSHLLAWALSVREASRHHPDTALVTDSAGARMLVDGLGLEFGSVSTALDRLDCDPSWWSMGKLVAVSRQQEPFVHLDADVFLWRPLPDRLTAAPVLAQNPEPFTHPTSWYDPASIEDALACGGWLPAEWSWYRRAAAPRGECCGIVGGTRVDFLQHWARQALRLVRSRVNQPGLALLDRPPLTITVEQYLLAACVEHHRGTGRWADVSVEYLFDSWAAAGDERAAAEVGFTHLIADTKRDPRHTAALHRRVRTDHPDLYERALALTGAVPLPLAA